MGDVRTVLNQQYRLVLGDLEVLAGDRMGPSGAAWQDVAGTAATNLRKLAGMLDSLRQGETHYAGRFPWEGPVVFPSPTEAIFGVNDMEE